MDNQIGTGAYDALVGRLLNIGQQQGGIISAVGPELSTVLVLENDRAEWCYLKNERCCAGMVDVAANAAHTAQVRIRNPVNSGALIVIEAISFSCIVATISWAALFIGTATADLAGGVSALNVQRDSRTGGQKGVAIISSDNANVAGASGIEFELQATSIGAVSFQNVPIILGPGSSLDFSAGQQNQEFIVPIRWREREQRNYEK